MLGCEHRDPPLGRLLRVLRLLQWALLVVFVVAWVGWWVARSGWVLGAGGLASIGTAPAGGLAGSGTEPRPERRATAPGFELTLFDAGTLRLGTLRGQVVVLNFWASWCLPCRAEAPTFARVSEAFGARGVRFVGVNIQDNDADARAFIQELGITYPNGPDPTGQITTDYGVAGLPTTIFVDAEGRIARRWLGGLTERQLVGFIEEAQP